MRSTIYERHDGRRMASSILINTTMFSRTVTRSLARPRFPIRVPISTTPIAMTYSTVTEAITTDHREILGYYDEYIRAKEAGDADAQARWVRQFTWELARHSAGEEIVVYPLFEKYLGAKGKQMADEDRAEHLKVKELLYQLENFDAGTATYHDTLSKLMTNLKPHIEGEEANDLPALEPHLGADGSKKAAASFKRTKKLVPTRPHPSAPDKPPFETLAGLLAAPMDKIKDIFAKFPTDEMEEEAATRGH